MSTNQILHAVHDITAPEGFELLKDLNQFRKPTTHGFQTILLSITPYDEEFIVEVQIGARHNQVEKTIYQLTNGLISYQQDSMTFVTSLGRLAGNLFLRFQVEQEKQLVLMQEFIHDYLHQNGFEFLKQLSDIHFIEALYNNKPSDSTYFYNYFYKALRGLVLARYVDNPNYVRIRDTYALELDKRGVPLVNIKKFNSLAMVMNNYSAN
jgi:hypothetical protein